VIWESVLLMAKGRASRVGGWGRGGGGAVGPMHLFGNALLTVACHANLIQLAKQSFFVFPGGCTGFLASEMQELSMCNAQTCLQSMPNFQISFGARLYLGDSRVS